MTIPDDVQAAIDAEKAEWGKWRAKIAIDIDGVRAFNIGHAVPSSHVEKFDLQDAVEPADAPPDDATPAPVKVAPQGDPITLNP
jgi:hypothetical protein